MPDTAIPVSFAKPYIQTLDPPVFGNRNLVVDVLRLDTMHPVVSGNKWFKLKYHLQEAVRQNARLLISFGGSHSNHLVALAYAAREADFASMGFIRGEPAIKSSPSLIAAGEYGMQIKYLSRSDYKTKSQPHFLDLLQKQYPDACIIPEGGGGLPGILGSAEILQHVPENKYSHIFSAIGTGTTFEGLLRAAHHQQEIAGVPVLKGLHYLCNQILLHPPYREKSGNIRFFYDYHFGGYARKNAILLDFMNKLFEQTGIPTDFVYTGKLFYAVYDLISKDYFQNGDRLLIIHSGGLQGNRSLPPGTLNF